MNMLHLKLKDNPELQEMMTDVQPGAEVVLKTVKGSVVDKDDESIAIDVSSCGDVEVEKEPKETPAVKVVKDGMDKKGGKSSVSAHDEEDADDGY